MRQGVPYTGAELAQYEEAMRLVPALLKLRAQERPEAVQLLLDAYQRDGLVAGVSLASNWSILFVAAINWVDQLAEEVAREQGSTQLEVLEATISAAADWASSGI